MASSKPILVDGEPFIATISQSSRISKSEFMAPHRIRISETGRPIFVHGTRYTEYHSASAFCRGEFIRMGKTNQWAGPNHIFVIRGGQWVSLNGSCAILD